MYYWYLGVFHDDLSLDQICVLVTTEANTSDVPLAIMSGDDWLCEYHTIYFATNDDQHRIVTVLQYAQPNIVDSL